MGNDLLTLKKVQHLLGFISASDLQGVFYEDWHDITTEIPLILPTFFNLTRKHHFKFRTQQPESCYTVPYDRSVNPDAANHISAPKPYKSAALLFMNIYLWTARTQWPGNQSSHGFDAISGSELVYCPVYSCKGYVIPTYNYLGWYSVPSLIEFWIVSEVYWMENSQVHSQKGVSR